MGTSELPVVESCMLYTLKDSEDLRGLERCDLTWDIVTTCCCILNSLKLFDFKIVVDRPKDCANNSVNIYSADII